ncbi:transcriptional regulator, TetR family [Pilibacter termitis]|uniref:Transcriptional regulator, TetR family n=1 Tax=Pilibacter termitis TaxID=263852 RepID=A0A1T4M3Z5_9ENTE|nr:TetR family transcriptional regulator [Pilibacter termitis]SJZ61607.1 transcriptional regulator, TetR family [Pilibacter termitis]
MRIKKRLFHENMILFAHEEQVAVGEFAIFAGLMKGTVYRHFPNKQAIFE